MRAWLENWKCAACRLQDEVHALYLACRDKRTPWYAKALGVCIVAYALSPIDLIPDPIPVLGYLDDLVIVPAGLLLVRRLIPRAVLEDCRRKVNERAFSRAPQSRVAAAVIVCIWLAVGLLIARLAWRAWAN